MMPQQDQPPNESSDAASDGPEKANQHEAQKPKRVPKRTSHYLPTDRVKFSTQLDILRAYGVEYDHRREAVSNEDVARTTDGKPSTVALLNAFFTENDFLTKTESGSYTPAPEVVAFAKAHDWDTERASRKLGPLLGKTWFAKALAPKLRFGPKSVDDVLAPLAELCGATAKHRSQLAILLDYLSAGGLIEREGEMLRWPSGAQPDPAPGPIPEPPLAPEPSRAPEPRITAGTVSAVGSSPHEEGMRLSVDVNVSMAELSGWTPDRISAFFSGIAQVLAAKGAAERSQPG